MTPETLVVPTQAGHRPRGRGLAAQTPERRREIASMGGITSHKNGTAHKWTAEEAAAAGRKGDPEKKRKGGGRPAVKISPATRTIICYRLLKGERGADLAREYGVTPSYISLVKAGKR